MKEKLEKLKDFCVENKISISGTVSDIEFRKDVVINFFVGSTMKDPEFAVKQTVTEKL